MSVRRVAILLGKDFKHGSKGFVFILAIVGPILISLVLNLVGPDVSIGFGADPHLRHG